MKIKEIVQNLELARSALEWDYPLDLSIAIGEAIDILKSLDGKTVIIPMEDEK